MRIKLYCLIEIIFESTIPHSSGFPKCRDKKQNKNKHGYKEIETGKVMSGCVELCSLIPSLTYWQFSFATNSSTLALRGNAAPLLYIQP